MAAPEPRPCPHCESADTKAFPDGSGACNACGRAFRGGAAVGTLLAGEEVEVVKAKVARGKNRLGLVAVLGGLFAFLAIPLVFVIGAYAAGVPVPGYTSDVFNRPAGAVACLGVVLLTIFGYYALWSGYFVWQGHTDRGKHALIGGALVVVAALLAGQGLPGIVGIVGGLLTLVVGLLVWRAHAAEEQAEKAQASQAG